MDILVTILVGALIGWIASLIMHTDQQMGALYNILAGIIGAYLARVIFGEALGLSSAAFAGQFSILGIIWGIVGALIVIAIARAVNIVR